MTRTILILIIVISVVALLLFIITYFLYSRYTELKKYVIALQNNAVYQQNTLDRLIGNGQRSAEQQRVLFDRQTVAANNNNITDSPPPTSVPVEMFGDSNGGMSNLFPLMNNLMNIFQTPSSVTDDIEIIPDDESITSDDDDDESIAVEEIIKEELQELEKCEKKQVSNNTESSQEETITTN